MTDQQEISELLARYLEDNITPEQRERLRYLLEVPSAEQAISAELKESFNFHLQENYDFPDASLRIKQAVNQYINENQSQRSVTTHRVHLLKTTWFRYAAAILLIAGMAALYINRKDQRPQTPLVINEQPKGPATEKAILTLSDGRKIVLDTTANAKINDGNISIEHHNGVLTYNAAASINNSVTYNTMSTPRGGQYQLILPDGSKVWLNSASNIRYPTIFNGKNRTIELTGEAYFDIKKSSDAPFIVKTRLAETLVLGTTFNINAYEDEPSFSATLISGSVKVIAAGESTIILPGQQANISYAEPAKLTLKNDVDIHQVIAWQKGIFEFNGASLEIIARQLTRWYDVDITTANNTGTIQLSGGITRKTPLKTVLKNLEASGVHHKWNNNKITLYVNN